MDEARFRAYLKRGGRSPSAQKRVIAYVRAYERFLEEQRGGKGVYAAGGEDLEAFVAWVERAPKTSAKKHLWALRYYYDFVSNEECARAGELREQRIKRAPSVLCSTMRQEFRFFPKNRNPAPTPKSVLLQARLDTLRK